MIISGIQIVVRLTPITRRLHVNPIVTPTRGLGHDRDIHFVGSTTPNRLCSRRSKQTAIEKHRVGPISKLHHIFRIASEILMHSGWSVVSVFSGDVHRQRSADRSSSIPVLRDRKFGVPGKKLEWNSGRTSSRGPPVVTIPVVVPDKEIHEHVINHGIDIEMRFHRGIYRRVGNISFGNIRHGIVGRRRSRGRRP